MKRNNRLFIGATKNFVKSANASGNRFSWGGKAFFEKSEELFVGRKGHRACIKTLSFKPVPVFHDIDGLLLLTFCVPVLKVHFHWFPVLPVPAIALCVEHRAAAILQVCFKSSFPPVSGFYRFWPFRFVLDTELLPFLTPIFHPKIQAFKNAVF